MSKRNSRFFRQIGQAFRDLRNVLILELPRAKPGWSCDTVGGHKVVTYRQTNMWRGTGLAFDALVRDVISRRSTRPGVGVHLRHPDSQEAVWFSTAHCSPGVTQEAYESEVADHLKAKPRGARSHLPGRP